MVIGGESSKKGGVHMNQLTQDLEKNGMEIEEEKAVIDLVCGMELEGEQIKAQSEYKGKKYYFCADNCKKHFDGDPEKYAE